jgi:hypothetical protein
LELRFKRILDKTTACKAFTLTVFNSILGGYADLITFDARYLPDSQPIQIQIDQLLLVASVVPCRFHVMEPWPRECFQTWRLCRLATRPTQPLLWAAGTNYANACYARMNETGNLIGTALHCKRHDADR